VNENCLEGMACPVCKSEGPFHIDVTTTVLVHDDGTEYDTGTDTLWSDDSCCMCAACDHTGTVADFTITTQTGG
jgi:hypothetical protein